MDSHYDSGIADEALKLHINDDREDQHSKPHINNLLATRRVTSQQKKAHDITKQFAEAAKALGTGQLIKDDFFTLFEAVGALEIMDPKMDSGYLGPGETLEDEYNILREILPDEVVGIMDQLLCSEVAWYMGNHLPQTLFSSLYIDRLLWPKPTTLEQACFKRDDSPPRDNPMLNIVLRAYCLALIKTCDHVHKRICNEIYYEEEDFVSNLYNRNLLSDFDTDSIVELLDQAIGLLKKTEDLKNSTRIVIACRLKFRRELLHAVALEPSLAREQRTVIWSSCLTLLSELTQSRGYGTPVPTCFSSKIQRRLASTVPPRPLISTSITDAHDYLKRLLEDGIAAGHVLECSTGSQITNFVLVFQSRKPQPSTYIRCLLTSLVNEVVQFKDESNWSAESFRNDLAETVLPAPILVDPRNFDVEAPHDPRFHISTKMKKFVGRAGLLYLDLIRCLNMNRSRTRRTLCHTAYDWEVFQLDAEELDVELQELTDERPLLSSQGAGAEELWSFPLSSWVYYHKLRQLEWIVQLGFELHIYQDSELAGMYWFLHYLSNTRLLHLQRIHTFTTRQVCDTKRPSAEQTVAFELCSSFLKFAILEASATQSFADALACLYILLTHLGLIPANPSPYSTPEFRYSLRMKPFSRISIPAVPSYADFTSVVDPFSSLPPDSSRAVEDVHAERLRSLLDSADLATRIAQEEWKSVMKASVAAARCHGCEKEWRVGQMNVLKSVIKLGLAVAEVKAWVAKGSPAGRLRVEIAGSGEYHDWWIVPKVTTT